MVGSGFPEISQPTFRDAGVFFLASFSELRTLLWRLPFLTGYLGQTWTTRTFRNFSREFLVSVGLRRVRLLGIVEVQRAVRHRVL